MQFELCNANLQTIQGHKSTYDIHAASARALHGSCASVKESMRTAVRFPKATDFKDLNLGLALSFTPGP